MQLRFSEVEWLPRVTGSRVAVGIQSLLSPVPKLLFPPHHQATCRRELPVWRKATVSSFSWQVVLPEVFSKILSLLTKQSLNLLDALTTREKRGLCTLQRAEPPCGGVFPPLHLAKIRTPVCFTSETFKTSLLQASYSQELSGRVNKMFSVALEIPDKSPEIFSSNQQTLN